MEMPQHFVKEIYEEIEDILIEYPNIFDQGDRLILAEFVGGISMKRAINKLDFPPCSTEHECATCWMEKYCVHKATPLDERLALRIVEDLILSSDSGLSDATLKIIETVDKTVRVNRHHLFALTQPILAARREANDKAKDS